ncbi:aldo/keto reductase [Reticulibacter mediterranei]|uniref:aldo/keto reductase n=1 Tax=Reticulibacter mediterranei TaxID=2778369 RepID=UPI0035710C48
MQGLPAGVWGVPSFLPSFARRLRRRAKEKKKGFLRGHPAPRQRAAALCTPARWENWKALKEAGKIRHIDLSNVTLDLLTEAQRSGVRIASVKKRYNPVNPSSLNRLLTGV